MAKILKLKFGQDSKVIFWSKHLRLRFSQDFAAAVFQSFESGVLKKKFDIPLAFGNVFLQQRAVS